MDAVYDVAIVGAGPIGIELAVALKKAELGCVQFDARQVGHTISWFAPQTRWFSSNERIAIAGVPLVTFDGNKATREQYLAYLRAVVTQFDLKIRTFEPVVEIRREASGFRVITDRQERREETLARQVVLATGGTERPRRLGIEGEDLPQVTAYFQEPHLYFQKDLLIIGGRNSAAEAALRCYHAGARVTLSYRGAGLPQKSIKYWLLPELEGLIAAGKIRVEYETTPVKIEAGRVILERRGERFEVAADFVLKLIGYEADMSLLEKLGARLAAGSRAPWVDERTMETSVPGVFVAGTAVGGTQERYELFLENCHVHVERIVGALTGKVRRVEAPVFAQAES